MARLQQNTHWFRNALREKGFKPLEGESAIVPLIIGDTARAIQISHQLLEHGVFVTGFGFPVVPEGKARIRFQLSSAHTKAQLEKAVQILCEVSAKASAGKHSTNIFKVKFWVRVGGQETRN